MKPFSIILLVMIPYIVSAQQSVIDSLLTELQTAKEDTNKVHILNKLSFELRNNKPEKAMEYAEQGLDLSKQIGFTRGTADSHRRIGIIYGHWGNYKKALELYLKSLKISESLGDKKGMADTYNNIGIIHSYQGNYEKALEFFFKSLKIREELGDKKRLANAYNHIGIIHSYQGNYKKALEFYFKSLKVRGELGDKKGMADTYNNIGIIHYHQGNYEKALEFYFKCLSTYEEIDDKQRIASSYNNIGETHHKLGDYMKSLNFFLKCLEIRKKLEDKRGLIITYISMGMLYSDLKEYQKSIISFERGLALAKEIGSKDGIKNAFEGLSKTYAKLNKFEKAYEYHEQYSAIKDSLFNKESAEKIAEMQTKYETEKKEKEIALLQKEKEIQVLNLGKQKVEVNRQKLLKNSFIIGFILTLLLAFVAYRNYRIKQKDNKLLAQQKVELAAQKDEIEIQNENISLQNKTLIDLNHEKNHLIGIVAHDLKSPLNQIEGLVNIIKLTPHHLNNEQSEYINKITLSTGHLKEMIGKILDVNAIESEKLNIKFEKTDLSQILNGTINDFMIIASKKNIQINTLIEHGEYYAKVDKNYTSQVFENLVSNAIKFSPFDKNLFVKLHVSNGKLRTEIIDEGPGLSREDMKRLFGKYQKLSARPTGDENSTGLGLSIVRKYVEAMNGKVWCESEPGKGANFIVEFDAV